LLAPLISPKSEQGVIYVIHQQAVAAMRNELAQFFARFNRWVDVRRFQKIMDQNGKKYEQLAIFKLARQERELPVYEVMIQ
jgi:ABC-type histidine transport system ATPase subunit